MANIGVVLAGGASKGAYELGVLYALREYFGMSNIRCISSASIGSIIAQTFGMGKEEELCDKWKNVDTNKHGKFFLAYSGKEYFRNALDGMMDNYKKLPFEHYVSVWNYSKHKVEYIPMHTLCKDSLKKYLRGAISIPFFSKGELIEGDRILDGAFLDNIPAYPLVDKDLDYIFCVYFDNCRYIFENETFDKKIIKLFDFPNLKRLEIMKYNTDVFSDMVGYGYDYTIRVVKELFENKKNNDEIYKAIADREQNTHCEYKHRLTADVVLNNLNIAAQKYSKRLSTREKV
ncbi:MAG: patatin-like phospholipase family protein [Clostridia bacterium]|nr:patatin-like phospholipase family protein [Clostridia bacterium]